MKEKDLRNIEDTIFTIGEAVKQTIYLEDGKEKSAIHLANIGALFAVATKYSNLMQED